MDNEVSTSMAVTIQIMVVGVVVGMLTIFMALGQGFGRDATTKVADTQALGHVSELRAMAEHGPVPAAALLAVLQKSEHGVRHVGGFAYGISITKAGDLATIDLLSKKVRIALTPVGDQYDVAITPE
ncbi:hypothetical protein ACF3MZ_07115 [Paenibacillaceae bacterium WGS1546]|uniref:hypothetical protein n=1 Tax=Cohnella sp. WGS1546 TaxID=3366810 RepID=UPI00372D75E3